MAAPHLTLADLRLLRVVRDSDEDHGGLASNEVEPSEIEPLRRMCDGGFVEAVGEYGEAPDGEEDEREAGDSAIAYRITELGVAALVSAPFED